MAGESAEHAARRMRERAERLHRAADLWERGAEGERRTAEALAALPAHEWTVFHDVPWPGRARANIDHVAVGPTGVFVIDAKHWSGSVTVRDGVLRQNGYRRDKTVSGAVDASTAVHSLLPAVRREDVRPVLCFARDEPLKELIGSVVVTSTAALADELHRRPLVFPPEGRQRVAWELELRLRGEARRPATAGAGSRRAAPPSRTNRRRRRGSQSLVSAVVGGSLAIGAVGIGFSRPEVFQEFGHAFVSLIGDDAEQRDDEPVKKRKGSERKKDRQAK
ncbi:hypothetical protein DJ010_19305 [Nocardioides silvaticus]|uniref:NERD domain-containing protein n=1 Tax=Nocardioides silvaticus TaxID=2201891 RepID=A0A316TC36_9ACTN|nr:nuclease-related domain-containing protein [Nocardioides silvaticus]PWN01308.1 hypothetical protein DJ010_19305 [Nocardioides silvaticus]